MSCSLHFVKTKQFFEFPLNWSGCQITSAWQTLFKKKIKKGQGPVIHYIGPLNIEEYKLFSSHCSVQIEKKLKSLERCQSLEEIQRLFDTGDYQSVVRLLQATLSFSPGSARMKPLDYISSAPERPAQLLLLQVKHFLQSLYV